MEFKQSQRNGRVSKLSPELNEFLKIELPKRTEFKQQISRKYTIKRDGNLFIPLLNTPEVQSVETLWAYVKSKVPSHFIPNRTPTIFLIDVIMAFQGNPLENHPSVTMEFVNP